MFENGIEPSDGIVDGRIANPRGIRPAPVKALGAEQFRDRFAEFVEAGDHQAKLLLPNPPGIVSLVNHRADIAFDDDRQVHGQGFADTARSRFSDEEIGEMHEMGYIPRETLDWTGI